MNGQSTENLANRPVATIVTNSIYCYTDLQFQLLYDIVDIIHRGIAFFSLLLNKFELIIEFTQVLSELSLTGWGFIDVSEKWNKSWSLIAGRQEGGAGGEGRGGAGAGKLLSTRAWVQRWCEQDGVQRIHGEEGK